MRFGRSTNDIHLIMFKNVLSKLNLSKSYSICLITLSTPAFHPFNFQTNSKPVKAGKHLMRGNTKAV